MQHRFVLPLFEPHVIAYLRALERQPIQVMLGREGDSEVTLLHNELPWRHIVPVVGMCQENRQVAFEKTLAEVTDTVRAICRPETIPSLYKGGALTEVSVSVILPMAYCLSAAQGEETPEASQR